MPARVPAWGEERLAPAPAADSDEEAPPGYAFSVAYCRATSIAPAVAEAGGVEPSRRLTIAIAAHIERRRRTRGLTDVDALQQDVLRELERLRFAVPSSSARWRVLRLAECGFSHKEVVLSEIRGRLSPVCKSVIKGDYLDKCIAKSFVASKRKQHPAHAALILVEARADELAKGQ